MVIASIVSDLFLMYVHRYRERYREGKISVCDVDNHGGSIANPILLQP